MARPRTAHRRVVVSTGEGHTGLMTQPSAADRVARVAQVFDGLADDYDQSGVPFFVPIAARLCELADPRPGEHVLDLGCGRGAVTLRAAEAVAPSGSVTAADLAPSMLEHTRDAAAAAGLTNVVTELVDATAPGLPPASFDLLTASLVLFFLPDPGAAVTRWLELLRPGGRLALTTFGDQDEVWRQVDLLFAPYLPPALLDPRARGADSPFSSDDGVEALVTAAGGDAVHTVRERLPVRFADAAQWRAWTMSTGQRAFWGFVPEERRGSLFDEAAVLLEQARDGGDLVLHQDVRYTLCSR